MSCLHSADPVVTRQNPAAVWSGEYNDNTEEGAPSGYPTIENVVTVEPTEAEAKIWYSTFTTRRAASCIGEAERRADFQSSPGLHEKGNSVGNATVVALKFHQYGEQSSAFRDKLLLNAERLKFTTYADYVLVRKGRAHMILRFEKLDAPQSRKLEERLIRLTAQRLRG
jgi:hypothetical protein